MVKTSVIIGALLVILVGLVLYDFKQSSKQSTTQLTTQPTIKPAPLIITGTTYQPIEVMADPLPQAMTTSDAPYKDGYAKAYVFQAQKGQRLAANAAEDLNTSYSFIKSELYDEEGRQLYDRDTRIEFEAPYTGKYYYIVRTFENKTGNYVLKIFDEEKLQNKQYVELKGGQKITADATQKYKQVQAFIIEFTGPIELTENNKIIYYDQGDEFNPKKELITTEVQTYMRNNTNQELNIGNLRFTENKEQYRIKTKIEKTAPNTIRITPENGVFPQNQIVSIEWAIGPTSSYGTGFITEYEY